MSTTILKGEVQTRIDALVYSSGTLQASEVMQDAADTVGLDCNLDIITGVYNSMLAQVDGTTSNDDITSLNVISIALGITTKPSSGGGSHVIGALKTLHVDDTDGVHTSANGDTWLKTGVIETNAGLYPDAKRSFPAAAQTGGAFVSSNSTGATNIRDVLWEDGIYKCLADSTIKLIYGYDASFASIGLIADLTAMTNPINFLRIHDNYYVHDFSLKNIWEFDLSWVHTGYKIDVSPDTPYGMGWDGTHLLISTDGSGDIHKYSLNGTYEGVAFSVGTETIYPRGITFDGYLIWVASRGTSEGGDAKVYGYNPDGTYSGNSFVAAANYTYGLCMKDGNILVADTTGNEVHEYTGYLPFVGGIYTGSGFYVGSQEGQPTGVTWDGSNYWVVGPSSDSVHQYTSAWVPTGFSFSVVSQASQSQGITFDGTHLWVVGSSTDSAFKYTLAGVYTGVSIDVSANDTTLAGLTWDGTHLWILGNSSDRVYQYTDAGVYTGTNFYVGSEAGSAGDIVWDGTHFWVLALIADIVHKYTALGVYTGETFSVVGEETSPLGLGFDGTHFLVVGLVARTVFTYSGFTPYVGIPSAETDISTGYPKYLKIKGGG